MNIEKIKEAIEFLEEFLEYARKNRDIPIQDRYIHSGTFLVNDAESLKQVIALLQRGEKIEEDLIQFLEKENPYPEDVFLPIPKKDFDKINDFLKKEMGYPIDRLSGNMGRKLYKSIIEVIKEVIK